MLTNIVDNLFKGINFVLKFVGLGTLPTNLSVPTSMAEGGKVEGRGTPGKDSVHALLAPVSWSCPTTW